MRRDPCAYCGRRPAGTLDHIDPHAGGGSLAFDNTTAACIGCNNRKGTMPLLIFLLRRSRIPSWR